MRWNEDSRLTSTEPNLPKTYCPHEPHPKQAQFLAVDTLEALYGGAAGGGKSDALLMAALAYVHVPGYSALLLRRTFEDLAKPDALIPRSKEWLMGSDATWNDQRHQWTFPSGATLSFGYLQHEDDKYHYQGAAYQFVGWDELTQFTETQYTYLFSRCRRPSDLSPNTALADVPLRIRAASNPGGIGHEWVKKRFAIDREGGHDEARPFVPARLEDNPSLDSASYEISLSVLDLVTRSQLRYGDWDIGAIGNIFQRQWWQRYHPTRLPVNAIGATFVDVAHDDKESGDYCVLATWVTSGLDFYLTRLVRAQMQFPELVQACLDTRAALPEWPLVVEETSGSKPLIQTLQRTIPGVLPYPLKGENKTLRAQAVSSYVESKNCWLPLDNPLVGDFIEEHGAFPNGAHDDMVDTTSMALSWLSKRQSLPPAVPQAVGYKTNGYHERVPMGGRA